MHTKNTARVVLLCPLANGNTRIMVHGRTRDRGT